MFWIDKFFSYIFKYLFTRHVIVLSIHYKKSLSQIFCQDSTKETYWQTPGQTEFPPPEQVEFSQDGHTKLQPLTDNILDYWRVLPTNLREELKPLLKWLFLLEKYQNKRKFRTDPTYHGVSDHIYEM